MADPSPAPPPVAHSPAVAPAKRQRPAPAKTFQCRGFGECRMVFSRSEHLARHVRKHTGERPFSCHCGKQFSRLDNLRQHAQTVHSDKTDLNDQMMRELTSLHTSMAANASKRGDNKRIRVAAPAPGSLPSTSAGPVAPPHVPVKQEDGPAAVPNPRPGTSAGYEGGSGETSDMYDPRRNWGPHSNHNDHPPTQGGNHSFLASQSFRAPDHSFRSAVDQSFHAPSPSSNTTAPTSSAGTTDFHTSTSQSFHASSTAQQFRVQPFSRALPPLASVVPPLLPPPSSHGFDGSGRRPGTAPASFYAPSFFSNRVAPVASDLPSIRDDMGGRTGPRPPSPTSYDSPFSFHPPGLASPRLGPSASRKRTRESLSPEPTESRPQSRRLSVLELCNSPPSAAATGPPNTASSLGSGYAGGAGSRPTSSHGRFLPISSLGPTPAASRPGTGHEREYERERDRERSHVHGSATPRSRAPGNGASGFGAQLQHQLQLLRASTPRASTRLFPPVTPTSRGNSPPTQPLPSAYVPLAPGPDTVYESSSAHRTSSTTSTSTHSSAPFYTTTSSVTGGSSLSSIGNGGVSSVQSRARSLSGISGTGYGENEQQPRSPASSTDRARDRTGVPTGSSSDSDGRRDDGDGVPVPISPPPTATGVKV